jgi:hypothetical protein
MTKNMYMSLSGTTYVATDTQETKDMMDVVIIDVSR